MNHQLLDKVHQALIGTRRLTVPQRRHTGIPVCQETRVAGGPDTHERHNLRQRRQAQSHDHYDHR